MKPEPTQFNEDPTRLLGGRYRLDRQIARGGMAEVWLGFDTFLNRQVAVKVLKPQLVSDEVVTERFRREAIVCAGLNHPNIVAVYDTVEDEGRQAVVMQYVQGKSLRELLDRRKRLGPLLTIHIGAAMAAALDAAHRAGLVHRDVKPGNILLTPDGKFLLADFGIAKAVTVAGEDLTHDNIMMGTAKYLSPEQVRGKPLDGRADLYGLGLVLYECLAGRVPFLGETDADTALARLQREPTDLAHLRPSLAPQLVRVVHKLLARNPEHRYPTGEETRVALVQALSAQHDHTTSMTPPAGATPPKPLRRAMTSDESSVGRIPGQPVLETVVNATPDKTLRDPKAKTWRPSTVPTSTKILAAIAVLLCAAVLFVGTKSNSSTTESTQQAAVVAATDEPVSISRMVSFDPNGDDAEENEAQIWALRDGNPKTAWTTDCYANQFFGTKEYVGVLIELTRASTGTLQVGMKNGPWSLEIYTATGSAPSRLDQWGARAGADYNTRRGVAQFVVPGDAQFILLLLREVGKSVQCSDKNPYQGVIQDVSFNAA
ncbi:MAG: protein kinase domain-containing protein [Actinomycetota bacterium]|nr:serine/threonine protein kinase [Actinomycetota bacterium]